jgi:hypothetical protein
VKNIAGMAAVALTTTALVLAVELDWAGSDLGFPAAALLFAAGGFDWYLNHDRFVANGQVRLPVCMLAGVGIAAAGLALFR